MILLLLLLLFEVAVGRLLARDVFAVLPACEKEPTTPHAPARGRSGGEARQFIPVRSIGLEISLYSYST
jgi:hypothetical protein